MMNLEEINTTWLQDVGSGIEIISWDIIEMPLVVSAQMLRFLQPLSSGSNLPAAGLDWVARLFTSLLRYASLFSLAHLSSEIFILPQDAHIRGIMVQLHLKAILETSVVFFFFPPFFCTL